jgi:hypothetical protein
VSDILTRKLSWLLLLLFLVGCGDQTIVNLEYTPHTVGVGGKEVSIKFRDMMSDPRFDGWAQACRDRNGITTDAFAAAMAGLRHPSIAKKSIAMIIEFQYFLQHFLEKRLACHPFYKIHRAQSPRDLTRDCVKYATKGSMMGWVRTGCCSVAPLLLAYFLSLVCACACVSNDHQQVQTPRGGTKRGIGSEHPQAEQSAGSGVHNMES